MNLCKVDGIFDVSDNVLQVKFVKLTTLSSIALVPVQVAPQLQGVFSSKGPFLGQLLKIQNEFSHEIPVFIVILFVHSFYPECMELSLPAVLSPKSQPESRLLSLNCFWTKLVALRPEL